MLCLLQQLDISDILQLSIIIRTEFNLVAVYSFCSLLIFLGDITNWADISISCTPDSFWHGAQKSATKDRVHDAQKSGAKDRVHGAQKSYTKGRVKCCLSSTSFSIWNGSKESSPSLPEALDLKVIYWSCLLLLPNVTRVTETVFMNLYILLARNCEYSVQTSISKSICCFEEIYLSNKSG